jgi:glycosyltransferase involved in cell wall biosynthesis
LSGSGVRVKLLEAFAVGIPSVATRLGAEGLTDEDGRICLLADSGEAFADAVVRLLEDEQAARELARRARTEVEQKWDMASLTRRLEKRYREVLKAKASPDYSAAQGERPLR